MNKLTKQEKQMIASVMQKITAFDSELQAFPERIAVREHVLTNLVAKGNLAAGRAERAFAKCARMARLEFVCLWLAIAVLLSVIGLLLAALP
jgi:hypothetical protein